MQCYNWLQLPLVVGCIFWNDTKQNQIKLSPVSIDRFVLIFITVIRHNFIHLWATLAFEKFIDSKIDGHFNTILKMKCQIEWTKKKLSLNISLQLKALNLFVFCLIYLKHFLLSQIHCWTETIKKKKRILAHLTLLVAHS